MAKSSLIEQLDDAVQAIIDQPNAPLPRVDAKVAPLLRLAAELRDLPREEFKSRLGAEFGKKGPGAALAPPVITTPIATPHLIVRNAAKAIEFYKKAFGATETMRLTGADGRIGHAEIRIGGSPLMLADEFPERGANSPEAIGGSPVKIHLCVPNVDALAKQALAAGAREVRPVADQFYGQRAGQFADPFGYTWILSTPKEALSPAEMQKRYAAFSKSQQASAAGVGTLPRGFHTVTPYLVVQDAPAVIEFAKRVFGAEQTFGTIGSAGGIHAEVRIGDSKLMIGGGSPELAWRGQSWPTALHIYVEDTDAAYQRALQARAASIAEPADQFYGERSASVRDTGGNHWYIATSKGKTYTPEGLRTVTPSLHPLRAEPVISFLKRAFGAEEVAKYTSPEGVVHHAKLRIGDSVLEMGEAHGPYQPMPTMFYLHVPDVDALYRRAVAAGGTSISEPADQPYGDRVGGVKDAFGNQWYLATHVKDVAP